MAYGKTITRKDKTISGVRYAIYTVVETDAAAASEFKIDAFPFFVATLVKYKVTHVSGTGATVNPTLGKSTGWTADTQDDIGTNTTTAAHIDDETHLSFDLPVSEIFVKSTVNAGTDNVIHTTMIFAEGII